MSFIGDIASSLIGADSDRHAANQQRDAARESDATQRYFYDTTRADNMPALDARNNALGQLQGLMKDPSSVTSEPGYQFGMNQGVTGIDRSAASHGNLYSGATLKALQRYGQDYAGTKLNDSYNRLASIAGVGQVGSNNIASAGMNAGNQIGQTQASLGNALAANTLNTGNRWGNALSSAGAYGERNGWFSGGSGGGGYGGGGLDPYNNLGGAASAGDYSDARLKTNLRPIGRTTRGNTVYAWDWKTGGSGVGVIAQEVQHIPGAVHADADGLLMVDYSKV